MFCIVIFSILALKWVFTGVYFCMIMYLEHCCVNKCSTILYIIAILLILVLYYNGNRDSDRVLLMVLTCFDVYHVPEMHRDEYSKTPLYTRVIYRDNKSQLYWLAPLSYTGLFAVCLQVVSMHDMYCNSITKLMAQKTNLCHTADFNVHNLSVVHIAEPIETHEYNYRWNIAPIRLYQIYNM